MRTSAKTIATLTYAGMLLVVLAWIAGTLSLPLLGSFGQNDSTVVSLLAYTYGRVCHQIAERSFYIAGQPLAVCARCSGIYAGYLLGLIVYPLMRPLTQTELPRRPWLIAALIPVMVDFAAGYLGILDNTLASRALTGAIAGAAGAFYTLPGLVGLAASLFKQEQIYCRAAGEDGAVPRTEAVRA